MAAAGSIAGGALEFIFTGDSTGLKTAAKSGEKNLRRLERAQTSSDKQFKRGKITGQDYIRTQNKITESVKQETRALSQLGIKVQGVNKVFKQGSGRGRSRHGAHAAQEVSRGIADFNAAGGFTDFSRGAQGAANNVERMTEILGYAVIETGSWKGALKGLVAGFLGPVGIITAVTLLVQFGPKLYKFFKDAADPAGKLKEEITEATKALRELTTADVSKEDKIVAAWTEIIRLQDEYIKALKSTTVEESPIRGVFTTKKSNDLKKEQIGYSKLQQTVNELSKEQLEDANEKIAKEKEQAEVLRAGLADNEYKTALLGAQGESAKTILASQILGLKTLALENIGAAAANELLKKRILLEEKLATILRGEKRPKVKAVSALTGKSTTGFSELVTAKLSDVNPADQIEDTANRLGHLKGAIEDNDFAFNNLGQTISSVLTNAANSSDNFGEALGKGLLSAIGSILIQIGTAALLANSALKVFGIEVSTPAAIAAIVFGTALVAASGSIGGGSSASAGGGGSSASQVALASPDPSFTQGGTAGGGIIGKIRGNDWVLMNQVANDRRNGQTGSFSLG